MNRETPLPTSRRSSGSEFELLLDTVVPVERPRADYRQWAEDEWRRALYAAAWHRVTPALFSHLDLRGGAPRTVSATLERIYLASVARSLFIASSLDAVLTALREAEVPAMLLKGAALVATVYPNPAHREMLDLDLLVPSDRLAAANRALAPLGYGPLVSEHRREQPDPAPNQGEHHGPPLVSAERLLAVELHHHIAIEGEGRRFEIDDFWARARTVPGRDHLLPSAEDLLLHVCLHFTRNRLGGSAARRHTGGALGQVADIAQIIAHEPINWDLLVGAARRYRLDARVFLALFAASELGVPLPAAALAELQPPGFDPRLGRRVVALRVLRAGDHLPVRTLRWMFAPSRELLSRGWDGDATARMSLARAYLRRAWAHAPLARSAVRRPWAVVQDRRLNGQLHALEAARD